MTRTSLTCAAISVLLVLAVGLAQGQTAPPTRSAPTPSRAAGSSAAAKPRQEPCWKVVGISKSAIEQRKSIEQNLHSQIQAVCADSSLTAQQKQAKIHELRQQAHQQLEGLITPQQQEALKACREQRGLEHAGGGTHHGGSGMGPCGEMPTGSKSGSGEENKPEPEE